MVVVARRGARAGRHWLRWRRAPTGWWRWPGRRRGDVLVFAHAHILRVVAARWLALPAGDGSRWVLGPASVSVLGWERETPVIERWNDTGGDPLT